MLGPGIVWMALAQGSGELIWWPYIIAKYGLGFLFLDSVERSDTSLLIAYLMVVGIIFVIVNTVVDIVYGLVNPTVRVVGRK